MPSSMQDHHFNFLVYYSYICMFIIAVVSLFQFLENYGSEFNMIAGIYAIIAMTVLWFFPAFHPLFTLTRVTPSTQ